MCPADECQGSEVAVVVVLIGIVGLDGDDPDRLALPQQGRPEPVLAVGSDAGDLTGGDEVFPDRRRDERRSLGSQDVRRQAAALADPERLPRRGVRERVDEIDGIREVDRASFAVVERDIEVASVHQLADRCAWIRA